MALHHRLRVIPRAASTRFAKRLNGLAARARESGNSPQGAIGIAVASSGRSRYRCRTPPKVRHEPVCVARLSRRALNLGDRVRRLPRAALPHALRRSTVSTAASTSVTPLQAPVALLPRRIASAAFPCSPPARRAPNRQLTRRPRRGTCSVAQRRRSPTGG